MIRVGIWGCGGISTQHRNAYRILEEEGYDVKLVALCDINPESFNKQVKINISTDDCVIPKIDMPTDESGLGSLTCKKENLSYRQ